jgi:hypothetical protein
MNSEWDEPNQATPYEDLKRAYEHGKNIMNRKIIHSDIIGDLKLKEDPTIASVGKFKMEHCPHLVPDSDMETVTIMKHSAMGATECILRNEPFISRFKEDTREWEHIPMVAVDVQMDGMNWEYRGKSDFDFDIDKWDNLINKYEQLDLYMGTLKQKYPSWIKEIL